MPILEKQSELLKKLIYKKLSISGTIDYSEHLKCWFPYFFLLKISVYKKEQHNRISLLYLCSSMASLHEKTFSKAHKNLNLLCFVTLKGHQSKIRRRVL